jgi:hypothetical protein
VILPSIYNLPTCAFLAVRGSLATNVKTDAIFGGAQKKIKFRGGDQEKQN